MGDNPGPRADRQGVLAGQRGRHAPVGGDVRQARVAGLEQEPGRDMVSVGGEGAGAEPVIAGEAAAGGVQLAEQAGEAAEEFGVPTGLIVLAGPGDADGQAGEVGWRRGRFEGGAGEHQDERLDAGRRAGDSWAGQHGSGQGDAGQLDEGPPSHRFGAFLASRWCRLGFGSILVPQRQAEPAVQQLVPFRWAVVAAFPGADHPDQAVMGGDGLVGGAAEPPCQLGHVPSAGPPPFAQLTAVGHGHRRYLRIAIAPGARPCSRILPHAPSCHYPTTARYR
jgi:hypothetical protein